MELTIQGGVVRYYNPTSKQDFRRNASEISSIYTNKPEFGNKIKVYLTDGTDFYVDYDKLTAYNGSSTIPSFDNVVFWLQSSETTFANAASTALAASLVVKATPGVLKTLTVFSNAAQYIQVHDAASLPADTAVPAFVTYIAANATSVLDINLTCDTGIVVCNSSTAATKTIGSGTCWFSVNYV